MNNIWRRIIAAVEMIGGALGLVRMVLDPAVRSLSGADLFLALLVSGLYLLALTAGFLLWRNDRIGRRLSIAAQLLQLPRISSGTIVFMITYAFDLSVLAIDLPAPATYALTFHSQVGPEHMLFIGNPTFPFTIGFSLVSCLFLWSLLKKEKPNVDDAEMQEISPAELPVSRDPIA